MYRRMLVPLDGSKLAEEVFFYAGELAGRLDIDMHFLNVCDPDETMLLPMRQVYVEKVAETVKERALKIKADSGEAEGGRQIEVVARVATGYPPEEILKYADENQIDIILMATHGASGVRRWALGSTAHKVLHAASVPVWLVRSGVPENAVHEEWFQRGIMVPLDGSELAETALPHAEALAKQRGLKNVEVTLLRVCEPILISEISFHLAPTIHPTPLTFEEYVRGEVERVRKRCTKYLNGIAEKLKAKGIRVRIEVLSGNPADEIIRYVTENTFQLIVMASHGRSGLSHLAFGSVAEKVLLSVKIPVLIVTPKA